MIYMDWRPKAKRIASASGNLQPHSILITNTQITELNSTLPSSHGYHNNGEKCKSAEGHHLTPVSRTDLKTFLKRRSTLPLIGQDIHLAQVKVNNYTSNTILPISSQESSKDVEEHIDISSLKSLEEEFKKIVGNLNGKISLDGFKTILKRVLGIPDYIEHQITVLFHKIDFANAKEVSWNQLCTFLHYEYSENEDNYYKAKEAEFLLPAMAVNLPNRDITASIKCNPQGMFITCSENGLFSYWTGDCALKRTRSAINDAQKKQRKTSKKWITDFCIMEENNKVVLTTGDREIQFLESSSFDPYCQIKGFENMPMSMNYCVTDDNGCILIFGDDAGCINVLIIKKRTECLRNWKRTENYHEGFPTVTIQEISKSPNVKYMRWKAHSDWVNMIKYVRDSEKVFSCSTDEDRSLVIGTIHTRHGNLQASKEFRTRCLGDEKVFKVNKGIKCFDYDQKSNTLVTGGLDRIVRLWNPYINSRVTGALKGHNSPVHAVFIDSKGNRLFSVSRDLCVKIWDLRDQFCINTVHTKGHRIMGEMHGCFYNENKQSIAIVTDKLYILKMKTKDKSKGNVTRSHDNPVTACAYNRHLNQVVTCCQGSVVKVWDFQSGLHAFEFTDAHCGEAIACMAFDDTGKRLITGGRDGCVRIWNYNNGNCLKTLMIDDKGKYTEILAVSHLVMRENRYIIAVGWDRRINIYTDDQQDEFNQKQYPIRRWSEDKERCHKDDIMSLAVCRSKYIVTSSWDGEIRITNMMTGMIFHRFSLPFPKEYAVNLKPYDNVTCVDKVFILPKREFTTGMACLVASGPHAFIYLWKLFDQVKLMSMFKASEDPDVTVKAITTNPANSILITGDSSGVVTVWCIKDYATEKYENKAPELRFRWTAHVDEITSMEFIGEEFITTSSADAIVRMWNARGDYIGTFGQSTPWDVDDYRTYKAPMGPPDVLEHTASLIVCMDELDDENQIKEADADLQETSTQPDLVAHEQIENVSSSPLDFMDYNSFKNISGLRRNFSQSINKLQRIQTAKHDDRPLGYHMLPIYELLPIPMPRTPDLIKQKRNETSILRKK